MVRETEVVLCYACTSAKPIFFFFISMSFIHGISLTDTRLRSRTSRCYNEWSNVDTLYRIRLTIYVTPFIVKITHTRVQFIIFPK